MKLKIRVDGRDYTGRDEDVSIEDAVKKVELGLSDESRGIRLTLESGTVVIFSKEIVSRSVFFLEN